MRRACLSSGTRRKFGIAWPMRVQGRSIVDQNGAHIFFASHGGAQNMLQKLQPSDYDVWFANAQANYFNSAIITILGAGTAFKPTTPAAGDGTPFTGIVGSSSDLTTPRESFFHLLDQIVNAANDHGIILFLDPDPYHTPTVISDNGTTRCRTFGQYLGSRYANKPNIVWMSGNDYAVSPGSALDSGFRSIALGIKDNDHNHLHTIWTQHEKDNTSVWTDIVDFFTIYEYEPPYNLAYKEYNNGTRPTVPIEFIYEGETQESVTPTIRQLRTFAYDASPLTGAVGTNFGDKNWTFPSNWKTLMTSAGNRQGGIPRRIFESRAWWDLVPDQNHDVIIAGYGTPVSGGSNIDNDDYAPVARTPDGSLIMLYMPTARSITVDMTKSINNVYAKWYDPETGITANISGPFSNIINLMFTPPSRNGDSDWVFILEP